MKNDTNTDTQSDSNEVNGRVQRLVSPISRAVQPETSFEKAFKDNSPYNRWSLLWKVWCEEIGHDCVKCGDVMIARIGWGDGDATHCDKCMWEAGISQDEDGTWLSCDYIKEG